MKIYDSKKSLSSKMWLDRHFNDQYVKAAHQQGYRSRAAFKFLEIDKKFKILHKARKILDLGAAPGGWAQVISNQCSSAQKIVAVDLIKMTPLENVTFIQGDFFATDIQQKIIDTFGEKPDLIVCDIAHSTSGHRQTDALKMLTINEEVLEFCIENLNRCGNFVIKIFQSGFEKKYLGEIQKRFEQATFFKPTSSRKESVEIYIVAHNFL